MKKKCPDKSHHLWELLLEVTEANTLADFKLSWTLLGLTHYTRLKTMFSLIECYSQGWALFTLGSDAGVHQFGI